MSIPEKGCIREEKRMNIRDYGAGRDDGLLKAYEIVKDGGIEALKKELEFRRITGIHTTYMNKELDKATAHLKEIIFQTIRVANISILHDTFGFGQVRCQRFLKAYDKLAVYLSNGWIYWIDIIEKIKKDLKLTIETGAIERADMGGTYMHPEPQDIYSEKDLIDREEWKNALSRLNFRERKASEKTMEILDHNGEVAFTYEDMWEQIQLCDVLTGVWIAKERWGFKE